MADQYIFDRFNMGCTLITPETKQQSMHWCHSGSSCKTKSKQTLLAWKVMCMVFWDREGILPTDFLTRGETVNVERYCKTLQKFRWAIQNKRCSILSDGVILLHDNASPHMARQSTYFLQEFCWEVFNHPLYSPGLVSSDFSLILQLKKFLFGQCQHFQNDREVEVSVTQWFQSQAADFYDIGYES